MPISVFNPIHYSGWKKFEGVAINGFKNHNSQFINDSSKSREAAKNLWKILFFEGWLIESDQKSEICCCPTQLPD